MNNAHVRYRGKRAPCGMVLTIGAGARPDGVITLTGETGATVEIEISNATLHILAHAFDNDTRFRVDRRPGKPDPNLADDVDNLFDSLKGR
jgi:hypothetical protein